MAEVNGRAAERQPKNKDWDKNYDRIYSKEFKYRLLRFWLKFKKKLDKLKKYVSAIGK